MHQGQQQRCGDVCRARTQNEKVVFEVAKDMDGQQCLQAVALEKLYSMLPVRCMHHCRDKKPKTSLELSGIVSDYLADHNLTWQEARRGMRKQTSSQNYWKSQWKQDKEEKPILSGKTTAPQQTKLPVKTTPSPSSLS